MKQIGATTIDQILHLNTVVWADAYTGDATITHFFSLNIAASPGIDFGLLCRSIEYFRPLQSAANPFTNVRIEGRRSLRMPRRSRQMMRFRGRAANQVWRQWTASRSALE